MLRRLVGTTAPGHHRLFNSGMKRVIKNLLCCNESSNPVEQKSHDVINNKLSRVMKEVAEESMKMAAVEEYSSSPDNL
ncbi:hypothetical protein TNCV_4050761 [Trichonephila clavipes]|nr:hypothetical protein TNCV_4050761 [Trichonephila clavipes]